MPTTAMPPAPPEKGRPPLFRFLKVLLYILSGIAFPAGIVLLFCGQPQLAAPCGTLGALALALAKAL